MELRPDEIAQIIKIGTTAMLLASCAVIFMVVYLHNKMVKSQSR